MTDQRPAIATATEEATLALVSAEPGMREALAAMSPPMLTLRAFSDLGTALREPADHPLLLPMRLLPALLRDALEKGQPPGRVIDEWVARNRSILQACRGHRQRVIIVDAEALARRDMALAVALGKRLGLAFSGMTTAAPAAPPSRVAPENDLIAVLTDALLSRAPQARALADEIAAMQLGRRGGPTLGMDGVLRACDRLTQLIGERDQLRHSLAALTGEIEAREQSLRERRELTAENILLAAQLAATERQLASNQDSALHRESVLGMEILESRRRMDGKLAAAEALLADTQERARRREELLGMEILESRRRLEAALHAIHGSLSWRVTGPLRAMRRAFGRWTS